MNDKCINKSNRTATRMSLMAVSLALGGLLLVTGPSVRPALADIAACNKLLTQQGYDADELVGKWYLLEIINNKKQKITQYGPNNAQTTPIYTIDVCPILTIQKLSDTQLFMIWAEKSGEAGYTFDVREDFHGIWESKVPQNGSMTAPGRNYEHFIGRVYLLKAVGSHLVLTFCSNNGGQQYSVLLARKTDELTEEDRRIVHDLLRYRGLRNYDISRSCSNGAEGSLANNNTGFILIFWSLIAASLSKRFN